jgi:hypothetical protein
MNEWPIPLQQHTEENKLEMRGYTCNSITRNDSRSIKQTPLHIPTYGFFGQAPFLLCQRYPCQRASLAHKIQ